jgi:MFS family permease
MSSAALKNSLWSVPLLVAALGYFVDIYDLLLFGIVRVQSLQRLHLSEAQVTTEGMRIISYQMYGLLLGGILWGVLGDKKGRLSVLFGSIVLYSIANIFNGFVQTSDAYAWCRFIAGIGLAGELGAGITLVSELVNKEQRGIATSLVAGIGLSGAVVAYFISQSFDWRICYFIGGGLGLSLLLLRIRVYESGLYKKTQESTAVKGNFFMFFNNAHRFKTYMKAILIGLPTWYVIGILISFSNVFAKQMGIEEVVQPGKAIMYAYAAISIGDMLIGFVSQYFKSRKKAMWLFYAITVFAMLLFFALPIQHASGMYAVCALLGFGTGFWAIFVTMAAEQFGTNLRATATTTIPNMVRGSLPLMLLLFTYLQDHTPYINAAIITGIIVMALSSFALYFMKETFARDLDFIEE